MRHPLLPFAAVVVAVTCASAACDPLPPVSPAPPGPTGSASAAARAAPDGPPVAAVRPVTETFFGTTVTDPYRWMEDLDAPEMQAFIKGQAEYARRKLDALPLRKPLLDRITELDKGEALVLYARTQAGKLFYEKQPPGADERDLFVREGKPPVERKILSVASLTKGGVKYAIDAFDVSPDGKLIAVGVSPSGSEDAVFQVIEVATGKVLPDAIPRVSFGAVRWIEARSFVYLQRRELPKGAPDSERLTKGVIKIHRMGDDPARDRTIFGYGYSPKIPVAADDDYWMFAAAGSPWVVCAIAKGAVAEMELWAARASELGRKEIPWRKIAGYEDEVTDASIRGDDIYLLTHKNALRFAVKRQSLRKPEPIARTIVPEQKGVIHALAAASDALYLTMFEGTVSRVARVRYEEPYNPKLFIKPAPILPEMIEGPFPGTIRTMLGQAGNPGVVYFLRGWANLPRTLGVEPKSSKAIDLGVEPKPTIDTSGLTTSFFSAKSADGTAVPLTVVHAKDLKKDGARPTWLDVYGSYGISNLQIFWPGKMAWFERGAVFAVCHARGGGELGEAWHTAAMREKRIKTMEENLIGCADELAAQGIAKAPHVAAVGKSAGGLPVSLALVKHPERFGAYFLDVGVVNPLRMGASVLGPMSGVEFGSLDDEPGFRALLATDALSQVKDGTAYPPVLLSAGLRDPRVPAWEPSKMAARLQAASKGKPALLRIDLEGGHFAERRDDNNAQLADYYAFLLDALSAEPAK